MKCKLCGADTKPLLTLGNCPSRAQYLPVPGEDDKPVSLNIEGCPKCGLVSLGNSPVDYYREVIRAAGVSEQVRREKTAEFTSWIDRNGLPGKDVLEVGCGGGEFLSILADCGVKAYGTEYSLELADKCRAQGLNVYQTYIESAEDILRNTPFDGFVCSMFIEHMPDPKGSLSGIYANLADSAPGIIEVPGLDYLVGNNLG